MRRLRRRQRYKRPAERLRPHITRSFCAWALALSVILSLAGLTFVQYALLDEQEILVGKAQLPVTTLIFETPLNIPLSKIFVSPGEIVRAGQIIGIIDDVAASEQLNIRKTELARLQSLLQCLHNPEEKKSSAEFDGLSLAVAEKAQAECDDARTKVWASQNRLVAKRRQAEKTLNTTEKAYRAALKDRSKSPNFRLKHALLLAEAKMKLVLQMDTLDQLIEVAWKNAITGTGTYKTAISRLGYVTQEIDTLNQLFADPQLRSSADALIVSAEVARTSEGNRQRPVSALLFDRLHKIKALTTRMPLRRPGVWKVGSLVGVQFGPTQIETPNHIGKIEAVVPISNEEVLMEITFLEPIRHLPDLIAAKLSHNPGSFDGEVTATIASRTAKTVFSLPKWEDFMVATSLTLPMFGSNQPKEMPLGPTRDPNFSQ